MTAGRSAVHPASGATAPVGLGTRISDGLRETAQSVGSVRIPEFVLFAMIVLEPLLPLPEAGFKGDIIFVVLICMLALLRRPRLALGSYELLVPLFAVAMLYLAVVSLVYFDGETVAQWYTRLARIMAVLLLVPLAGTGRIDLRSGALGYLAALVVNVPLYYAGLTTDYYPPYLTGALGDKNVSGLAYAIGLVMVPLVVRRRDHRLALMAFLGAALWLTGSRTSLAGAGAGLAWMYVGSRLSLPGKGVFALLSVWMLNVVEEDFSRIGRFSERLGSDRLRARIDAASLAKVRETGFFGQGLGEAYAYVGNKMWYFHNSYWTMLVEGGWPWTILVMAATVAVMFPAWRGTLTRDQRFAQGMGAVFLMCSTRLGEVMLTTFWGVAMALALYVQLSGSSPIHEEAEGARDLTGTVP